MRKYILIIVVLVVGLQASAQVNPLTGNTTNGRKANKNYLLRNEENGDFIYNHEFILGGRLNTDGWDGFFQLGHRKNKIITTFYELELGEIKDPKEDKAANPVGQDFFGNVYTSHPYIYGKQNIFYQLKLSAGQQHLIGGKGNKNGVEVSAVYEGGVSIGILRPYYLEVYQDSSSNNTTIIKYTPADETQFLDAYNIYGGTGLSKGWNELQVIPGIHARVGIRFDWAAFNSGISAVEVSAEGQYYTKKIPIMVQGTARQFFLDASVALLFGKRW